MKHAILAGFSQLMDAVAAGREKLGTSIEELSVSAVNGTPDEIARIEALIRRAQVVFFETADHVLDQFRTTFAASTVNIFETPPAPDVNEQPPIVPGGDEDPGSSALAA